MNGVTFNKKWNLLEENDYKFSFQNVDEPQLFRDMFDYKSVPKIAFNHRVVPMNMPDEIWITDTTFRDGQQSRTPFTVKQVVDLYKLLHKLAAQGHHSPERILCVHAEKTKKR